MNYHWNWRIFWEDTPDGAGTYLESLIDGLQWTLATTFSAWAIALLLGTCVGILRTLPDKWMVRLANAYIELFRNIPLLVQMFLWYFVLPELLPEAAGMWLKTLPNAPFITAVVSLGFFTSARVAVQVSSGIQSLSGGQRSAALALGFTSLQTYRYVLLPIAFRIILPSLTNEFAGLIKNTSVALTIGLVELTARTRSMQEFSFQTFEAFTVATLLYMLASVLAIFIAYLMEKKWAVPEHMRSDTANTIARGR